MNGSQQERELMAVLRDFGFLPIRAPGSGTGDWDLPDVLAASDGVLMAAELKSGDRPSNLKEREVDALRRVADDFWAASVVIIRYKGDRTFYLVPPDLLDRTDAGNYSVPSAPDRLDWAVGLPYEQGSDGFQPQTINGDPQVLFATGEPAPTLDDWLQALTTSQQGFDVRQGLVDRGQRDRTDDAVSGGDD